MWSPSWLIGFAPFFFCHHPFLDQQLNQIVDGIATWCCWSGLRLNRGSGLGLFWFRRGTFLPEHFKRRRKDRDIVSVSEAHCDRKAVGERGEVGSRPDRNTK